jgi:hypothetical protein
MPIFATIEIVEEPADVQIDRADRRDVSSVSSIRLGGNFVSDVVVHDFSVTGCRLTGVSMTVGTQFRLGLTGGGVAEGHVVREGADGYGCAFSPILSEAVFGRSFDPDAVVKTLDILPAPREAQADPVVERWPAPVRAITMVGSAVAAWAAFLTVYRLL